VPSTQHPTRFIPPRVGEAGGQLNGKAYTRPCPVLRGGKSGFASAGMTILLQRQRFLEESLMAKQTCHPDRSVAKWRDLLLKRFGRRVRVSQKRQFGQV
jgi:hypothetical protein